MLPWAGRQLLLQLGQLLLVVAALRQLLLSAGGKLYGRFGLSGRQEVASQGRQLLVPPQLARLLQAGGRIEQFSRQIRVIRRPLILQAGEGCQSLGQRQLLELLRQLFECQGVAPLQPKQALPLAQPLGLYRLQIGQPLGERLLAVAHLAGELPVHLVRQVAPAGRCRCWASWHGGGGNLTGSGGQCRLCLWRRCGGWLSELAGVCRPRWRLLPTKVEQQQGQHRQCQQAVAALHRLISPLTGK